MARERQRSEPSQSPLARVLEHHEKRRALLDRIGAAHDAGDLDERDRLWAEVRALDASYAHETP